jgi:hypothetical protein
MLNENSKQELAEMVSILKDMNRDELMQTYGFALGLKAKREAEVQTR